MVIKNANIDLHVHPFLDRNPMKDVFDAMNRSKLDVLALENFNESIYPHALSEAMQLYDFRDNDHAGMSFSNNKYILNAREYDSKERMYAITVGYSFEARQDAELRSIIDEGLKNDAFVIIDHPFVDNENTRTAGHISYQKEKFLEKICMEYSGQIALEWNSYCIPWIRAGLKPVLNALGHNVEYHDVNSKAEVFSNSLYMAGYNAPIVADTDLHGRNKRLLSKMGTSRMIMDIEGESPSDVVKSIKKNVFERNHKNIKDKVSAAHLFEAFCLPMLFPGHFWKPRA